METHIELKVLVHKEKKKVLFAEADVDFVDILFSLLTLPLGTIVRLMAKKTHSEPKTVGCFTNLSQSVKNLGNENFCHQVFKDMVVNPRSSSETLCRNLKINIDDTETKFFICSPFCQSGRSLMSIYMNIRCCSCGLLCTRRVAPSKASENELKAFLTTPSKFIITDCLQVMPVFPGMLLCLLQNLGVTDVNVIQERTVKLGLIQLLELLKLTFLSTTPLTDLFLSKKMSSLQKPSLQPKQIITQMPEEKRIEIKVMLKKSTKQFLYVEAHQDFVDFLLSFLIMPLGQLVHIMDGQSGCGGLDSLYKSVMSLDSKHFVSQDHKNALLTPKLPPHFNRENRLFVLESAPMSFKMDMTTRTMWANTELDILDDSKGFVRKESVFIVVDNLEVIPFSVASAFSILKRNNVSVCDLEEKTLSIGVAQGVRILRAALTSSSAISNALLHNDLIFKKPKEEK